MMAMATFQPMPSNMYKLSRFKSLKKRTPLSVRFAKRHRAQALSPLFNHIPPEIRNIIFVLALTSYDDKSQPYPDNSYYSRPGYRYSQRIDTNLLATCRRIYLETYLVPVAINEHVFWCDHGPPNARPDPQTYFRRLTDEQRDAVMNVHLFVQMYWLEQAFPEVCQLKEMRPRSIKLTIRHSDWWFWEQNNRLHLTEDWGRMLKDLKGLEELELELETMERDKDQVNEIAARMKTLQFNLHDERILSAAGTNVRTHQWLGPSIFDGSFRYLAKGDLWESIPSNHGLQTGVNLSSGNQQAQQPGLVYWVVTLKWEAIAA